MRPVNKSVLAQCRRELDAYERVLPSLDLKRRQLAEVQARERRALSECGQRMQQLLDAASARLPMMAPRGQSELDAWLHGWLDGLARLSVGPDDRMLGVSLPCVQADMPPLAPMALTQLDEPVWMAQVRLVIGQMRCLEHEETARRRRVQLLDAAIKRTMQKVNLFEKVLIPRTRAEIQRIRVALADAERSAIVRAKLARALMHRSQPGQTGAPS